VNRRNIPFTETIARFLFRVGGSRRRNNPKWYERFVEHVVGLKTSRLQVRILANRRERRRHGEENAKQYGEEPLAAVRRARWLRLPAAPKHRESRCTSKRGMSPNAIQSLRAQGSDGICVDPKVTHETITDD
jgi:hypothetical protein